MSIAADQLLTSFRTGKTGTCRMRISNSDAANGEPVEFDTIGDEYVAGLGDALAVLDELRQRHRRLMRWWVRLFFPAPIDALVVKQAIETLTKQLNRLEMRWVEPR